MTKQEQKLKDAEVTRLNFEAMWQIKEKEFYSPKGTQKQIEFEENKLRTFEDIF